VLPINPQGVVVFIILKEEIPNIEEILKKGCHINPKTTTQTGAGPVQI